MNCRQTSRSSAPRAKASQRCQSQNSVILTTYYSPLLLTSATPHSFTLPPSYDVSVVTPAKKNLFRACSDEKYWAAMKYRNESLSVLAVFLYFSTSFGCGLKVATWFTLWYCTGGKRWLYLFSNVWRRDMRYVIKRWQHEYSLQGVGDWPWLPDVCLVEKFI